jgi:4,5-DOPA dioxygenase extradiol
MSQPALFVSHGASDLAIAAHPAGEWLDALGATLTAPRAVLVVSAHDLRSRPTLRLRHEGRIVHDYGASIRPSAGSRTPRRRRPISSNGPSHC